MESLDEAAVRSDKEKRQRAAPIPGLKLEAGKENLPKLHKHGLH
jgi:hypothetical protein